MVFPKAYTKSAEYEITYPGKLYAMIEDKLVSDYYRIVYTVVN